MHLHTYYSKILRPGGILEQVLPDAAAVGIGIDFQAIVRRSLPITRRYIFCTIKCFVRIHRDVFQSQHLGHQDLVRWAIGADHLVVRSLRQGDCCQLGVGIIVFTILIYIKSRDKLKSTEFNFDNLWNRKKLLDIIVISENSTMLFLSSDIYMCVHMCLLFPEMKGRVECFYSNQG